MTCPSSSLAGKVCLIAGTTGIAEAAAHLAAAAGASLCLIGRTPEHGEALRDRLRHQGAACEFVCADLTHDDAGDRVVDSCVRALGRIDAAFNVAGISGRRLGDGPAHECTAAGWDAVVNTNARGQFLLCGALLRQMLQQPIGTQGLRESILNMASVLAWSPSPRYFATHAYAASKAAIVGFSRAMAAHYAPHRIRINVIAPSLVRTPMSQRAQQDPAIVTFMRTKQPLVGDLLTAEQVARAALFLLGDDAAAITGDVLTVDGGWCISEGQVPWRRPDRPVLGLDLGGTSVKGVALSPEGIELAREHAVFNLDEPMAFAATVRATIDRLESRIGQSADVVGLSAPGLAARDGRSIAFMPGRFPGLPGLDWARHLDRPSVPVLNDAHAALLGEVWRGAACGAKDVILLTLGTGVGGAAMVDGHLLRGHCGKAGHLGHISLNPDGPLDITGTPGSLEDAIGNHNIAARTDGRFTTTHDLIRAHDAGDTHASTAWLSSVRALAAAIVSLTNVLDPEVVIVGGGIARSGESLFRPLKDWVNRFEWKVCGHEVRIVPAELGELAGAYGAARNALDQGAEPAGPSRSSFRPSYGPA